MRSILFIAFLCICAGMDLKKREIWWPAVLIFTIYAVASRAVAGDGSWLDIGGGIAIGVLLLVIAWVSRGAIGYGDGLVVIGCGAALGFWNVLQQLFLALVFAACWAGFLLILRKAGRKYSFPFVPFLLAAGIVLMAL